MILIGKHNTKEIKDLEELLSLTNSERLELFGAYYPNKMVKSYGKTNTNNSLDKGLLVILTDILRWQYNIKVLLSKLCKDSDYIGNLLNLDNVFTFNTAAEINKINTLPIIEQRKYKRQIDKEIREIDKNNLLGKKVDSFSYTPIPIESDLRIFLESLFT